MALDSTYLITDRYRYASGFARKLPANLNESSIDFRRKVAMFLEYAEYDQHMVR